MMRTHNFLYALFASEKCNFSKPFSYLFHWHQHNLMMYIHMIHRRIFKRYLEHGLSTWLSECELNKTPSVDMPKWTWKSSWSLKAHIKNYRQLEKMGAEEVLFSREDNNNWPSSAKESSLKTSVHRTLHRLRSLYLVICIYMHMRLQ